MDTVFDVMRCYSSYQVRRLIDMALGLADGAQDADRFADAFYASMLDRTFPCPPGQRWDADRWNGPTSAETLPAIVGALRLCGSDPNRCLIEAASLGRDADTIASVAGGITGALHGASALRPGWITGCEEANAEFFAETEGTTAGPGFRRTAERLIQALEHEANRTRERLATLEELLYNN